MNVIKMQRQGKPRISVYVNISSLLWAINIFRHTHSILALNLYDYQFMERFYSENLEWVFCQNLALI